MTGELITVASDALTARINPLGAELWSLMDRQGREYMTDADPAFWTGHAPLLFPIVGALNGGCYGLGDATYEMPKHGFARHSRFELLMLDDHEARFALFDSEETRKVYPFSFALEIVFWLQGWTLAMHCSVLNRGDSPMPFSFGFHPAFAWPLPGGAAKEEHRVIFAQVEPQPIRRIDPKSGLLLPHVEPTPVQGRMFTPTVGLFEADALIWDQLASRSLSFGTEHGAKLDIGFDDTPMLGIWQKPSANYLCIEPWQGIADPQDYTGDFRDKPGVISLAPDAMTFFRMDVTVDAGSRPR